MKLFVIICVLVLTNCLSLQSYTITIYDMRDSADPSRVAWFYDGPTVVFVVRNNTEKKARLRVECGAAAPWIVGVEAHSEVRALGRLMNRDLHSEVCTVSPDN